MAFISTFKKPTVGISLPNQPTTESTPTSNAVTPSAQTDPNTVKIRDYLVNQGGYKPSDIGVSNGNVTLQGAFFGRSNPRADGYNYDTTSNLADRLKTFRNNQQGNQLDTTNNSLYNAVNAPPTTFTPYKPFEYTQANIEANPEYQAALALAKQNIQTGQNNTLAQLAANGQGNSSYATTVAQQIANKEMGNLSNNLVPQMIRDAYQRNLDTFNANNQVEKQNYGAAQDRIGNLNGLSSLFNGYQQQQYQNTQNEKQSNLNAANLVSQLTGKVINPQEDWSGLFRQAANPNTPLTLTGQQQQQSAGSKALQDAWMTAQQVGYVTPELSKITGIPQGTKTLDALQMYFNQNLQTNQFNQDVLNSNRNYNLAAADNALARDKFDYAKQQDTASQQQSQLPTPTSYAEAYKDIDNSMFLKKGTDGTNIVADPQGLADYIFSLNLPEEDTRKLYQRYGLKWGG